MPTIAPAWIGAALLGIATAASPLTYPPSVAPGLLHAMGLKRTQAMPGRYGSARRWTPSFTLWRMRLPSDPTLVSAWVAPQLPTTWTLGGLRALGAGPFALMPRSPFVADVAVQQALAASISGVRVWQSLTSTQNAVVIAWPERGWTHVQEIVTPRTLAGAVDRAQLVFALPALTALLAARTPSSPATSGS